MTKEMQNLLKVLKAKANRIKDGMDSLSAKGIEIDDRRKIEYYTLKAVILMIKDKNYLKDIAQTYSIYF